MGLLSCCERHRVGHHLVPTRVELCTRPSPHKRKPQSRRCSGPPQHLAALIRATPEQGGTHPRSAHSPPTLPSVSLARGPRAFRRGGQEFVHIGHEAVSITKIRSQVKRLKVGARRDTTSRLTTEPDLKRTGRLSSKEANSWPLPTPRSNTGCFMKYVSISFLSLQNFVRMSGTDFPKSVKSK